MRCYFCLEELFFETVRGAWFHCSYFHGGCLLTPLDGRIMSISIPACENFSIAWSSEGCQIENFSLPKNYYGKNKKGIPKEIQSLYKYTQKSGAKRLYEL